MDLALIHTGETKGAGNVHVGHFAFLAPGFCLPELDSDKIKLLP